MYYSREEKVDKDVFQDNFNWINLSPTSIDLIFYAPNVANLGFQKIVPTIALQYQKSQVRGLAGSAFSIRLISPMSCLEGNKLVLFNLSKLGEGGIQDSQVFTIPLCSESAQQRLRLITVFVNLLVKGVNVGESS